MNEARDFSEIAGWAEDESTVDLTDEQIAERLRDAPKPTLWRLLVQPRRPRAVSKGGIVLAGQTMEAESHLQYVGQVIAMGPIAGKSEKFQGTYNVEAGHWVLYGRYAGQRLTHRGLRLLMVDDDQIVGIVANPGALRVYV